MTMLLTESKNGPPLEETRVEVTHNYARYIHFYNFLPFQTPS